MILPAAYKRPAEFAAEVAEVEKRLKPQVVRIRHYFDDDATGEPAVFFLVVLSDEASRLEILRDTTKRIEDEIERSVEPSYKWDVLPYFRYRSESEQSHLNSPAWAA